jgi:hypothetical protein
VETASSADNQGTGVMHALREVGSFLHCIGHEIL